MEKVGRRVFAGVLVILVAVILSVMGVASQLDSACRAKFDNHLPVYPDATPVSSESQYLQYHRATYFTHDAVDVVKDWYNTAIYVALSESLAKTGSRNNVWDGEWDIQSASQGGSTIVLSRGCG